MIDFTTVVGIDDRHLPEFRIAFPTWRQHKPEIMRQPLLLVCDGHAKSEQQWARSLAEITGLHPRCTLAFCGGERITPQRERMLTALVEAAKWVKTPWLLKLDTDAIATTPAPWLFLEWFMDQPAIVASPWGYTKPAEWMQALDAWADGQAELSRRRPPPRRVVGNMAKCRRIISWLMFARTDFAQRAWSAMTDHTGRLPVPSQDTCLWYYAERVGAAIKRVKFQRFGWRHCGGSLARMRESVAGAA
jgi:hypothetical protein